MWLAFQDGAEPAPSAPGNPLMSWMPILLIVLIFWFVVLGPERKQRRARETMLSALKKGDRVVTSGGLYGTVAQVQNDVVTLQIAEGVRVRWNRSGITGVLERDPEESVPAESAGASSAASKT